MKYTNLILLYCGICGPALFFMLMYIVFPLVYPGFDTLNQHISQLGAIDSPIRWSANYFGFLPLGILLTLFSFGLRRILLDWYGKVFSWLVLLAGVMISSISFLPCDALCQNITGIGIAHNFISGLQVPILSLAILFFLFSDTCAKSSIIMRTYIVLWMVAFVLWLCAILGVLNFELDGLYQRIVLAIQYVGIVVISKHLIDVERNKYP